VLAVNRREFIAGMGSLATLAAIGAPAATATNLDVLVIFGQSNALGAGLAAQAPALNNQALMWSVLDQIKPFVEPPGRPNDKGDLAPCYSNEQHLHNSHRQFWMQCGVAGSSMMADGSPEGDWSSTGTLRYRMLAKIQEALAAIAASGHFKVTALELIWLGGEHDGNAGVARENFALAMANLVDWCYAQLPLTGFNIVRIGASLGQIDQQGWANVRAAQEDVAAAESDRVRMLYRGAFSATALGWQPPNSPHFDQRMLNMIGTCAAHERWAPTGIPLPLLAPPVKLGHDAIGTRAVSLKCVAGARGLVLATHGGTGIAPTINGVAAALVHTNAALRLWWFDDGSGLGGLMVDVNAGDADAVRVKQVDAHCLPEAIYGGTRSLRRPKDGPISLLGLSTGHPALVMYASHGTHGFAFDESSEVAEVTDKIYAAPGATTILGLALRRMVPGEARRY
jgi:hypothetical protein